MSLQGNLSGFSLPEIFRMIAFSSKTGNLVVAREESEGKVHFRDGEVYFASTPECRLPLGLRLVDAGVITREHLDDALAVQKDEPDRRLGQILVSKGLIAHDVLADFVRDQIQDALFEIFDWDDGTYYFEPAPDTDEDIGLSLGVEDIVAETERRRHEWERIREVLPSVDCRIGLSTNAVALTDKVELEPQEWAAICLVADGANVATLRSRLHMSTLAACRMVAGMISKGVLEAEREPAESQHVQTYAEPPAPDATLDEPYRAEVVDAPVQAEDASLLQIETDTSAPADVSTCAQAPEPARDEPRTGQAETPTGDGDTREDEATDRDEPAEQAVAPTGDDVVEEIRKYIRHTSVREVPANSRKKYPIEWLTYYGRLHRTPTRGATEAQLRKRVCEGAIGETHGTGG